MSRKLYIGLNDKDAAVRLVSTTKAKALLNAIAIKYVDGFTVYEAQGFWKDDDGNPVHEDTLVYEFFDAGDDQVFRLMEEMRTVLNQSTILASQTESMRMYYK